MRRSWKTVAVLLVASPMPFRALTAQSSFNGVITFLSAGESGRQDTFVQYTKGNKVRLDGFGASHGSMIIDNDAKVMMMVDPAKKQVMTMTEDDAKQMQAMMGSMMKHPDKDKEDASSDNKASFTKTGKTETVAGVHCEIYHGVYIDDDGDKNEGDACIAPGVGFRLDAVTFNNPMMQRGGAGAARMQQFRQLVAGNKGILMAKSYEDGKVKTDMEAVKIEPKALGDDMFAVPPGYKEVRLADMMAGAMKGMKMNQGNPQHGEPDTNQGQGEPKDGQNK
jgi:hypothetical protein